MTYGLGTFRNSNNEVIIDQNFRCVEVISSGTLSVGNFTQTNSATRLNFPFALQIPLVLWKLPVGGSNQFFFFQQQTTFIDVSQIGSTNFSLDYLICDIRTNNSGLSDFGLAVFDGQNRTVFSTNRRYLRGISTIENSSGSWVLNNQDRATLTLSQPISSNSYFHLYRTRGGFFPVNNSRFGFGIKRVSTTVFECSRTTLATLANGYNLLQSPNTFWIGSPTIDGVFPNQIGLVGE